MDLSGFNPNPVPKPGYLTTFYFIFLALYALFQSRSKTGLPHNRG